MTALLTGIHSVFCVNNYNEENDDETISLNFFSLKRIYQKLFYFCIPFSSPNAVTNYDTVLFLLFNT